MFEVQPSNQKSISFGIVKFFFEQVDKWNGNDAFFYHNNEINVCVQFLLDTSEPNVCFQTI